MAKNMGDTNFRKIDIDAYNEDDYKEEEDPDQASIGPDETEIQNFLNQNRHLDALKAALRNPPLKTRNQSIKDKVTHTVLRVLCSCRQSDIEKYVQSLDKDQQELLMKFVFKGFEFPQENSSAQLLIWHEKLVQTCGVGIIVRVLTDRKRL